MASNREVWSRLGFKHTLRSSVQNAVSRATFEDIIGRSSALKRVTRQVEAVAPTDSTVLITGESGTGKNLIARAIHNKSNRSGRPFVILNCAALSPALIYSELFGHERGAFPGAAQSRIGWIELAHTGTIMLDEVNELSDEAQLGLLQFLEERKFERLGGTRLIHVDIRVVAATSRDLKAEMKRGKFRSGLFYHLNVFPIELQPLRKRKDDIKALLEYFVELYASRLARNIPAIDSKTLKLFKSYDWPGNVRELKNVVERSVAMTRGDVLSIDESWLRPRAYRSSEPDKSNGGLNCAKAEEQRTMEAALAEREGPNPKSSRATGKWKIPAHTAQPLELDTVHFKYRN